jgi:hypothetical protein
LCRFDSRLINDNAAIAASPAFGQKRRTLPIALKTRVNALVARRRRASACSISVVMAEQTGQQFSSNLPRSRTLPNPVGIVGTNLLKPYRRRIWDLNSSSHRLRRRSVATNSAASSIGRDRRAHQCHERLQRATPRGREEDPNVGERLSEIRPGSHF